MKWWKNSKIDGRFIPTHGMKNSKEYKTWECMRGRCNRPTDQNYKYYGARGIKVCKRWEKLENFIKDMGLKPKGMTLDRIDNSKGYKKSNCRWVSQLENNLNKRNITFLEFNGVRKCTAHWAKEVGLTQRCLRGRILAGWSIKDALTKPSRKCHAKEN